MMPMWVGVAVAVVSVSVAVALIPVVVAVVMWLVMCLAAPAIALFEGNPRYVLEVWSLPFEIIRDMPIGDVVARNRGDQ